MNLTKEELELIVKSLLYYWNLTPNKENSDKAFDLATKIQKI